MTGERLRLRALVSEQARHLVATDGTSMVVVLLAQAPQHHPGHRALPRLLLRRRMGNGYAAQLAGAGLVRRLPIGQAVQVWADAVGICPHSAHLELINCTSLERLDTTTDRWEPMELETA